MFMLLRQIPIPLPTSPLKGEEAIVFPPLQGEGKGGGGVNRYLFNYGPINSSHFTR
jgi:hypothetical protein